MGSYETAVQNAAVEVLARHGSRGFTHRAVDQHAGLPVGTTSRYARSREALFLLVAHALFAADSRDAALAAAAVLGLATPDTESLARALAAAAAGLLAEPARYRARVELQLEAQRTLALRLHLESDRRAFVDSLAALLTAGGITRPAFHADVLAAVIDGLLSRNVLLQAQAIGPTRLAGIFLSYLEAESRPGPAGRIARTTRAGPCNCLSCRQK